MATTYYYPSNYGIGDFDPTATSQGKATVTGNLGQNPPGSYTVVTAVGTNPETFSVTTNYTGPGTGTSFTTTATQYTDANHSETYYSSPQGAVLFLLTNGPIAPNKSYTFGQTAPFVPTGGTTKDPTCFATGTSIATSRGEVAVEHLVVGDRVVTASGSERPIIWIGHRDIACGAGHRDLGPVRVVAHAFGPELPSRDLMLSPGHPVLVGAEEKDIGYLVPIMCLINGTTIERVPVDSVTYWHVELDAHDILLAEGLPAESYLDWGDRGFFSEGADHRLANPDFVVPGLAERCRPVALDGPVVEAERRRLDAVFAGRLAAAGTWPTLETELAY